jgi:hypothetical protein
MKQTRRQPVVVDERQRRSDYEEGHPCSRVRPGYYYGAAPGYGYGSSPPGWFENNTERGGPGPRVGAGSGMGIGSQR